MKSKVLLLVAALLAAPAAGQGRFLGPDGEPLPFQDDEEILEFLAKARVLSSEEIHDGIGGTRRLALELDGVRTDAAFRTIDLKKENVKLGNEIYRDFHDSYLYEVAAYQLDRLLGLGVVPPTVQRRVHGELGSLQLWVFGTMTEKKRHEEKVEPPDEMAWWRQTQSMRLFDRLIYNYDRHNGNILVDKEWRIWLIDHTRSFRMTPTTPGLGSVTGCDRRLYERLRELDNDEIRSHLKPFVGGQRMRALLKRRTAVLEHCDDLAANLGAENVFF